VLLGSRGWLGLGVPAPARDRVYEQRSLADLMFGPEWSLAAPPLGPAIVIA
jgi:hypothetical protein